MDLERSVSFIQERLGQCLETHRGCSKVTASTLPRRILSIGASESEGIKLIQPQGLQAKYATLSHCWGGIQPLRTTKSSLASMLVSISSHDLPIVFQQAILVARKLSIKYIWIDSLCIIQDSQSDWELESAKMCDYYRNSYLNISTASSPNHGVPFLGKRESHWWPAEFHLRGTFGRRYEVFAKRVPQTGNITDGGVLFSRAWAWQEAALAPRTIYFTTATLIWECWKGTNPDHYVPDLLAYGVYGFSFMLGPNWTDWSLSQQGKPGGHTLEVARLNQTLGALWEVWNNIVTVYSTRLLTYEIDRLPALSGAAARFQVATKCRYLAGFWEQSLPACLCWELAIWATSDTALAYTYSKYIAPSWSWASVSQAVEYVVRLDIKEFESYVTIMNAHCEVPGLNPFGRISAAHLHLKGKVAQVLLRCNEPLSTKEYILGDGRVWKFMPDCILVEKEGNLMRASKRQKPAAFSASTPCLYLGVNSLRGSNEEARHYALVLGQSDAGNGTFCRLGLAWLDGLVDALFEGASEIEICIV